ncbi:LOW QUALITY PROTEIN: hypothetical protein Cgig2_015117 [Carnegiea gigantea]|uniref:DUF7046 domain-containing protein n=1 Tax=Carnegiea gigantea TaxID=171969 RepID=A0A9Q1KQD0_9CARY|nr:LOW QUALITY PROTEIN: hypothetical protein Cgig2_015117 [Carnegiea gigantea]
MENGGLADKFGGLSINDAKDSSLFQVMKAVEAAEATIHQQISFFDTSIFKKSKILEVEENNRLRAELQKRDQELEKLKLDRSMAQRYYSGDPPDEHRQFVNRDLQAASLRDPAGTLALNEEPMLRSKDSMRPLDVEGHFGISKSNGNVNTLSGGQISDGAGFSQLSSPTSTSFSPGRYPKDGEYDCPINISTKGLMPLAESNNHDNLLKQIREREEEIIQLRRRLTEYSVREAQIRNEKYILEKRISHMRMAFDQQQQDLVDAASKALSYRQDIIEENVRLTYALQDAQQERTIFVSSLLPLLAEHFLQPQVSDAQSIVSNVKLLFKHLQEKLIITEVLSISRKRRYKDIWHVYNVLYKKECSISSVFVLYSQAKLKESQYQLTPWLSSGNSPNIHPHSPEHSSGAALTSSKIGLELVLRPTYSPANLANSDGQIASDWDSRGQHDLQPGARGTVVQNSELENAGQYSPLASRDSAVHGMSTQAAFNPEESHGLQNKQVKFKEPVSSSETHGVSVEAHHINEREYGGAWSSGSLPYSNTYEDPNTSYSPYLQPVPEEPSSSFSEAADDDPWPAIEGLQISGDAYPGRELQACGYSINGTTSCNFEWVRHLEDGSVQYIEGNSAFIFAFSYVDILTLVFSIDLLTRHFRISGAKQPMYLVTADDVENYLAIEVQPLDDRKRKGELVKVFANDHRKITCDPDMHGHIQQTLRNGHASYRVSLSTGYLDMWEPVTLTIKREGYSIKGSGSSDVTINEKFSPGTKVTITYGHDMEFSIYNASGSMHLLKAENYIPDVISLRDTIVLTLRLFNMKALQSAKGGGRKRRVKLFSK